MKTELSKELGELVEEILEENILLKNGQFMWRGVAEEISYLYRRRRLLGTDNQE